MDFASMDSAQLTMVGSGFSALLSMHFTIQLLSQHLFYWKNPKEQKAIIMIIIMAPLYAVDSFVGLLDIRGSKAYFMFLDSVKECYEAVAIAKFLALMYSYLNISISKNIVPDEIKGREIHHSFPMNLFQPHTARLDHRTLKLLKHWTWQFVIIRPVCSILMIALQILGLYPSWLSWTFTIILNISFSVAMYSLVVFYHVFSKELQPHKPLSKFICIKGIVFFSFWQGLLLKILVALGVIKSHHFWLDVEHLQEAIQNVLICVEMVFFSVMQHTMWLLTVEMSTRSFHRKRMNKLVQMTLVWIDTSPLCEAEEERNRKYAHLKLTNFLVSARKIGFLSFSVNNSLL